MQTQTLQVEEGTRIAVRRYEPEAEPNFAPSGVLAPFERTPQSIADAWMADPKAAVSPTSSQRVVAL